MSEGAKGGGRITTRLTVGTALLIAAAVAFVTILDSREQRNLIRDRIEHETLLLARTLNDELANALYFSDIERLRHLAEVTATHAEIDTISVFNREGRILVASGGEKFATGQVDPELLSAIAIADEPHFLDHDGQLRAVHPIVVGGEVLGGMLLDHRLDIADAEIAAMIRRHVWEGLVVMLVGVGLSWAFARRMVRPVNELMEVTRRIAGGDLDYAVVDRRDDELGDLATSLEVMRRELKESARQAEEERTEELKRSNERLRTEVAEREAAQERAEQAAERLSRTLQELSRAQQRVVQSEKFRAEAQMASGIAHDLSNTLQVILGVSENLLARPSGEADGDRLRGDLEMIAQASRDAAGVVSRLRKVNRHGRRSRFEPIDLRQLVDKAVAAAEPRRRQQAQTSGTELGIEHEVESDLITYGDARELRESLVHLIVNAIEAMPQGGTVSISGRNRGGRVLLEVRDSGVGMSEEVRLRATEPFFSTKGQSGSGLGLTLVQGTVARHSGNIEIDSVPGRGTTVRVLLPLGSVKGRPRGRSTGSKGAPMSILLVDDEESVRRTMVAFLELDRHSVTAVPDGVAAAEMVERQRFDLVLTDRDMPRIDGVELAAFLLRRHPEIPVIMMSGMVSAEPLTGALPEGVDRMLAKPVGLEDLRRAISELTVGQER